jgi:hypothetical protein
MNNPGYLSDGRFWASFGIALAVPVLLVVRLLLPTTCAAQSRACPTSANGERLAAALPMLVNLHVSDVPTG